MRFKDLFQVIVEGDFAEADSLIQYLGFKV